MIRGELEDSVDGMSACLSHVMMRNGKPGMREKVAGSPIAGCFKAG